VTVISYFKEKKVRVFK